MTRTPSPHDEPSAPSGLYYQPTKRFDSASTASSTSSSLVPWDGLRKDRELWFEDGDCLVHLYAAGTSRRGPSLKLPVRLLEESDNHYLLGCIHTPELPANWPREHELYVPAPPQATRREAFAYHVGTRNYFAYLASKPLVGESLALALTDLAHRIESWQPHGVASTAFLDYCERQGYLEFTGRPDHAAAALYLADRARIVDIWRDAFAHCVGMRDRLDAVPDAARLDHTTRRLVDRASTAMWLHVERTTRALVGFLDQELGPDRLGLTRPMRDHLDRFRGALHRHYVHRVSYFPPATTASWDRRLWSEMYHDFHCLYAYLLDPQSSPQARSNPRGVHGGICVAQNVQAFDRRHGFQPLPHPLPLLPESDSSSPSSSSSPAVISPVQKRSFRRSWTEGKLSPYLPFRDAAAPSVTSPDAAAAATHATLRPDVITNALVREYMRFERSVPREDRDRVSPTEARKVRWLLVYGMVQMLESITTAPPEVLDVDAPSYPLCIPFVPAPSWITPSDVDAPDHDHDQSRSRVPSEMEIIRKVLESDRISIRPDCQADSAQDYFTRSGIPTRSSRPEENVATVISALRSSTQPLMRSSSSIRSSVNSLHRSVVGGFSRVGILRRNSSLAPASPTEQRPSFREIMIEGYGNGSEDRASSRRSSAAVPVPEHPLVQVPEIPRRRMPGVTPLHLPWSDGAGQVRDGQESSVDEPIVHSPTTTHSSTHTDWRSGSSASSREGYESPVSDVSTASLRENQPSPKPSLPDPSRFNFELDDDDDDDQPAPPVPAPRCVSRPPVEVSRAKSLRRTNVQDEYDCQLAPPVPAPRHISRPPAVETPRAKSLRRPSPTDENDRPPPPIPAPRRLSRPASEAEPGASSLRRLSLNAGCYVPTGKPTLPPLPTAPPPPPKSAARVTQGPYRLVRSPSVSSVGSTGSSVYMDTASQAAEIDEVEVRGRRRVRGLDRLSVVGLTPGDISLPQTPDERAVVWSR